MTANLLPFFPGGVGSVDAGMIAAFLAFGEPSVGRDRERPRLPRDRLLAADSAWDRRLPPAAADGEPLAEETVRPRPRAPAPRRSPHLGLNASAPAGTTYVTATYASKSKAIDIQSKAEEGEQERTKPQRQQRYEIIIVGAGPAGQTAALYAGRSRIPTLVLERGIPGGELWNTAEVEDYPGFEHIMGPELADRFQKHAEKFGAKFETAPRSRRSRSTVTTGSCERPTIASFARRP